MIFNSFEFVIFFPVVFTIYWMLKLRAQNIFLLLASYLFYGFWDWRFLSLILLSTVVDYIVAQKIHASDVQSVRKRWVTISLVSNLGLLAVFKYFNFFVDSFAEVLAAVGMQANMPSLQIILPVGISFYTFQTLSYTIDVYRKDNKPVTNLVDFAVYVAYFPQLVAGPIERSTNLVPQLVKERKFDLQQVYSGATLTLIGFFKKIFVADNIGPHVDAIFATPDPGIWTVMAGGYLFAFQIYADFSGYTDIARGISRMMGIELRLNFNFPYVSPSPQEFWRRWHMSLSNWLRDYLYISLGGNRQGPVRTYANLMTTMVLGGLWHGAAWNYVLWGFFQGTSLCVHRWWIAHIKPMFKPGLLLHIAKILFYFQFTCYGWILFRATSLAQVGEMTGGLVQPEAFNAELFLPLLQYALPMIVIEYLYTREKLPTTFGPLLRTGVYAMAFYLFVFHGEVSESFLYFQF